MPMKEVMVAVRKKPNMTREARRMIFRYVTTLLGSDTVARIRAVSTSVAENRKKTRILEAQ